jgi:hypothetical protein
MPDKGKSKGGGKKPKTTSKNTKTTGSKDSKKGKK